MLNKFSELQQEIKVVEETVIKLQDDLKSDQLELDNLSQQYREFRVIVNFPKSNSPEDLAIFHQENATIAAKWSERLQGINKMLRTCEKKQRLDREQLQQKQELLQVLKSQWRSHELEQFVLSGGPRLQIQGDRINQLSKQLEEEIRIFKNIYQEVNSSYSELNQRSLNLVDFTVKTVPQVVPNGPRLELKDVNIDWQQNT